MVVVELLWAAREGMPQCTNFISFVIFHWPKQVTWPHTPRFKGWSRLRIFMGGICGGSKIYPEISSNFSTMEWRAVALPFGSGLILVIAYNFNSWNDTALILCIACLFFKNEWESDSHSIMFDFLQPHGLWTVAHQVPLSMASPGKNTGVRSHSILQGIFPT